MQRIPDTSNNSNHCTHVAISFADWIFHCSHCIVYYFWHLNLDTSVIVFLASNHTQFHILSMYCDTYCVSRHCIMVCIVSQLAWHYTTPRFMYHIMSHHFTQHVILHYITLHSMSYLVTSCHVTSCQMSYYIM